MPRYDDSTQTTAQVRYYAAVNSNSKNKQLAYDLAKAIMDLAGEDNIGNAIPINRNNFDKWMTKWDTYPPNAMIDGNKVVGDFDVAKAKKVIENIQYVTLNDVTVTSIVNDGMQPYIEGMRSFDDCYDETVNKLNLYINE